MGKYVRWQAILSVMGIVLLGAYLNSINVIQTIVVVPAEGGIFREGLVGKPQFLNPLLAVYNPVDQDITTLIFEGLTRDDGLGNLEP
ncbi:MAG: peptide ABC transporter substrate-binding protein, partial [Aliifodinibius sp.]|nr:peptide ABC transporter substrate-binding protein [Fodinibius sp.]NIV15015.1 peptide ABC transporter substrate-binding protein [Fodinibius sp.]NIY28861.1 peptide ABC transporter substrate-binding protein [Fodinibius sp.]